MHPAVAKLPDRGNNQPTERDLAEVLRARLFFLTNTLVDHTGWGKVSSALILALLPRILQGKVVSVDPSCPSPTLEAILLKAPISSDTDSRLKPLQILGDFIRVKNSSNSCNLIVCLVETLAPLAAVLKRPDQRLVIMMNGTYAVSTLRGRWGFLYRWAYRKADSLVFISRYTAKRALEVYPALAQRARVVTLGVYPNTTESASLPSFEQRQAAILFVGELKPRKGLHVLLEALALVRKRIPNIKLLVAGSTRGKGYVQQVLDRIARLDLTEQVEVLGQVSREELNQYFQRVRVFALPSLNYDNGFEGLGLVHLEANSWGLPTIGSLDCGNEDAIVHGVTGYLVKQGDAQTLAEHLVTLLSDKQVWEKISQAALLHAAQNSWDTTAKQHLELYSQLLKSDTE